MPSPAPPAPEAAPQLSGAFRPFVGLAAETEVHLAQLALIQAVAQVPGGEAGCVGDVQRLLEGQLRSARITNYWLEKDIQLTNALRKQTQLALSDKAAAMEKETESLQRVCAQIEGQLASSRSAEAFLGARFGSTT